MFWQHRFKNLSKLIYQKANWLVRCVLYCTSRADKASIKNEIDTQEVVKTVQLHLLELSNIKTRYQKQGYRIKIE